MHMSMTMTTTIEMGRLMLKLERSMRLSHRVDGCRHGAFRVGRRLHGLSVLQRRGRVTNHLVAFGEAARHHVVAGARIALRDGNLHLLQLGAVRSEEHT